MTNDLWLLVNGTPKRFPGRIGQVLRYMLIKQSPVTPKEVINAVWANVTVQETLFHQALTGINKIHPGLASRIEAGRYALSPSVKPTHITTAPKDYSPPARKQRMAPVPDLGIRLEGVEHHLHGRPALLIRAMLKDRTVFLEMNHILSLMGSDNGSPSVTYNLIEKLKNITNNRDLFQRDNRGWRLDPRLKLELLYNTEPNLPPTLLPLPKTNAPKYIPSRRYRAHLARTGQAG